MGLNDNVELFSHAGLELWIIQVYPSIWFPRPRAMICHCNMNYESKANEPRTKDC
jgi:hypothetical protein